MLACKNKKRLTKNNLCINQVLTTTMAWQNKVTIPYVDHKLHARLVHQDPITPGWTPVWIHRHTHTRATFIQAQLNTLDMHSAVQPHLPLPLSYSGSVWRDELEACEPGKLCQCNLLCATVRPRNHKQAHAYIITQVGEGINKGIFIRSSGREIQASPQIL